MLELHGRRRSNYFNAVKAVLIEKGIEFDEVIEPLPPTDAFRALSPMSKIPVLLTEQGPLTESTTILDYLEEVYPEPALLPADPYSRAKVREIAKTLELYIELEARRGYGVLRGEEVPAHVPPALKAALEKSVRAVSHLAKFSPWIAGASFTYADIYGYYMLLYARPSAKSIADFDLIAAIPGAHDWLTRVAERPSVQRVIAQAAEG